MSPGAIQGTQQLEQPIIEASTPDLANKELPCRQEDEDTQEFVTETSEVCPASQNDEVTRHSDDNNVDTSEDSPEDYAEAATIEQLSSKPDTVPNILARERELGRLHIRSKQAAIHSNLTILRIDELECAVQKLNEAISLQNGDNASVVKKFVKELPIYREELRRSNELDFPCTRESVLLATKRQPALEVLVSTHEAPSWRDTDTIVMSTNPDIHLDPTARTNDNSNKSAQRFISAGRPEKLRIRSIHLRRHLKSLSGPLSSFFRTTENKMDGVSVHSPLVFLRPFKYFATQGINTIIKESLVQVQSEIEREISQNPASAPTVCEPQGAAGDSKRDLRDKTQLLQHLKLLVEFIDTDLQPTLDLRQQIKDGTASEIEYADLWHLFERGDVVVTNCRQTNAYVVVSYTGGRDVLAAKHPYDDERKVSPVDGFVVDCISLTSDGKSYIPTLRKISIQKFHGRRPICSLPVYPIRFDAKEGGLRSSFINNGKTFVDITRSSFSHKTMQGRTLDEPSYTLDTQVIVDMALALDAKQEWRDNKRPTREDFTSSDARETCQTSWCKHVPIGCCGGDIIFRDLEQDKVLAEEFWRFNRHILQPRNMQEDVTETDLMIMEPYVHAFVLRSRQWVTARVSDLHEVNFENSFDDLVLTEDHKSTVQALVQNHERSFVTSGLSGPNLSIRSGLDLVKGKGNGLIILLHGPPGVGKTSTAECVADSTKRPLYPITCGDLGETAAEVESALQHTFHLAHKWGCVLILDEADVFLAQRNKSDLRHNAVTSVFLRSLEYYAGILFLTTNRVGAMDTAFISRIQLSLFYPALDLEVTLKIYEKFIARTKYSLEKNGSQRFKIKDKEILKFARRQFRDQHKHKRDNWNGRQIRNAFQTAIALTEHESTLVGPEDEKPALGKTQFQIVAEGFKRFDQYLTATLQAKVSDVAKSDKLRVNSLPGDTVRASGSSRKRADSRLSPSNSGSSGSCTSSSESTESEDDGEESDESPKRRKSKKKKAKCKTR